MTGLLLSANHRIQQHRIRECMRRVNPDGVLLRALELRAICSRKYQVPGPWHIDGNQSSRVRVDKGTENVDDAYYIYSVIHLEDQTEEVILVAEACITKG